MADSRSLYTHKMWVRMGQPKKPLPSLHVHVVRFYTNSPTKITHYETLIEDKLNEARVNATTYDVPDNWDMTQFGPPFFLFVTAWPLIKIDKSDFISDALSRRTGDASPSMLYKSDFSYYPDPGFIQLKGNATVFAEIALRESHQIDEHELLRSIFDKMTSEDTPAGELLTENPTAQIPPNIDKGISFIIKTENMHYVGRLVDWYRVRYSYLINVLASMRNNRDEELKHIINYWRYGQERPMPPSPVPQPASSPPTVYRLSPGVVPVWQLR